MDRQNAHSAIDQFILGNEASKWTHKFINDDVVPRCDLANRVIYTPVFPTVIDPKEDTIVRAANEHEDGHARFTPNMEELKHRNGGAVVKQSPIRHRLINILEDLRIERGLKTLSKAFESDLDDSNRHHCEKHLTYFKTGKYDGLKPINEAMLALHLTALGYTPSWEMKPEALRYYEDALPIFKNWEKADYLTKLGYFEIEKIADKILKKWEETRKDMNQDSADNNQQNQNQQKQNQNQQGDGGQNDQSEDNQGDGESSESKSDGKQDKDGKKSKSSKSKSSKSDKNQSKKDGSDGDGEDEDKSEKSKGESKKSEKDGEDGENNGGQSDEGDEGEEEDGSDENGGQNGNGGDSDGEDGQDGGEDGEDGDFGGSDDLDDGGQDGNDGDKDTSAQAKQRKWFNPKGGSKDSKSLDDDFIDNDEMKDEVKEELERIFNKSKELFGSYFPYTEEDEIIHAEKDKYSFDVAYSEISGATSKLANHLETCMRTVSRSRTIYNYDKGMSVNVQRHATNIAKSLTKNIFTKVIKGISLDVAVSILIDESGSCHYLAPEFRKIVIAFCEVLERIGIKFEVLGHTNTFGGSRLPYSERWKFTRYSKNKIFEHKNFNEQYQEEKYRLGSIGYHDCNIDGEALLETFKRNIQQTAKRHIILVFSDGKPNDYNSTAYDDNVAFNRNLTDTVNLCRKNNVEVYAFGIGTSLPMKFYGQEYFVYLPSVKDMNDAFFRKTAEVITYGRRV